MKPARLDDRLSAAQLSAGDARVLMLSPILAKMPLPMQRYDEPFLPFGKAIIDATRDLVSGYVFDLAAYLALGAAGGIALERTIAYARAGGDSLAILHGAFMGVAYASAAAAFNVDAVTLASVDPERRPEVEAAYHAAGIGVVWLESGSVAREARLIQADGSRKLWIVGADAIYAGSGDDFAERALAALQAWRQPS